MIYSETTIFDETFDCDSMEVGDSFHMNGTYYRVERKFNDGPFMSFTNTAKTLFIVSTEHNGQTFYQVCIWSGDWEGCHPVSDSIEGALFSELARLNEIMEHDEDTTGELDTYTNFYRPSPLRNASALYAEGCDPITAQYLTTGELPG